MLTMEELVEQGFEISVSVTAVWGEGFRGFRISRLGVEDERRSINDAEYFWQYAARSRARGLRLEAANLEEAADQLGDVPKPKWLKDYELPPTTE